MMNNDSNVQLIEQDEFAPLTSMIFHLVMTTERNALKEEQFRQTPVTGSIRVTIIVTFFLQIDAMTVRFRSSDNVEISSSNIDLE